MNDEAAVDGNAIAGDLAELFGADITAAVFVCASCRSTWPVAKADVYMGGPGTVVRCCSCEAVIMRFARVRGRLLVDMTGTRMLAVG
jgi:hypothetical protein